jgi:hypothetical protein
MLAALVLDQKFYLRKTVWLMLRNKSYEPLPGLVYTKNIIFQIQWNEVNIGTIKIN